MQNLHDMGVYSAAIGTITVGDSNYFPSGGNLADQSFYFDTHEIMCPGDQVMGGLAFAQGGNRVTLAVWSTDADGSNGQWITSPGGGQDYFGPADKIFVDTNVVLCPSGQVVKGVQFYQKGNRVAMQIFCFDPKNGSGQWVKASDQSNNDNYFPSDDGAQVYADANSIVLNAGAKASGVGIWPVDNRMAPYIVLSQTGTQP